MNLYCVYFRYKARYKLKKNLIIIFNKLLSKSCWFYEDYKKYREIERIIYSTTKYVIANSEEEAEEVAYTTAEDSEYFKIAKDYMYSSKWCKKATYKYIKSNCDQIWVEAKKVNLPISGEEFIIIANHIDRKYFHDFLKLCVEYKRGGLLDV